MDYKSGLGGLPSADEDARAWAHVFKNRWNPVWVALQDFDSHTLEAEALWGTAIRSKTNELRQCVRNLNVAMMAYIDDKKFGGETFKSNVDFGEQTRVTVFVPGDDVQNPLNAKIAKAISGIEQELRPHLRRT